MNKTFFTQKELAGHLGRPRQYVVRLLHQVRGQVGKASRISSMKGHE
jgi:hypothetical protein